MVVSKEQQDYYRILGVNKGCQDNEIKKSYYKLAKKWHPDKNGSPLAEEKFKEINKAYEILSDDKKRSTYDSSYTARSDILTRTSSYSAKSRSTYTPKSANFTFFTNTSTNNDSFNMDYDAKWRAFTNANNFYDQTRTTENPFAKFTNNFKPEYFKPDNIPPFTHTKFSRESFYKGFKKYFDADYYSTESDDDSDSVIIEDFYNELSKNAKKSKSERSKKSSSSKWKKNWDDMNKKNSPRNGSSPKSNQAPKTNSAEPNSKQKKSNIPEPPQNDFKFNPEHPLNGFKFNSKSDPFELLETFAMYKLFSEMSHRLFKDVDDEEMLINLAKIISSFNLPPKNKMNTSPMNSFRKQNNQNPSPQKPQPTTKPTEKSTSQTKQQAPPPKPPTQPTQQPTQQPNPTKTTTEKTQEKKNSDFVFSETIRRKKEENDARYERSRSNATPSPTESSNKTNNNSWEFEWMGKKQTKQNERPESSNSKVEEEILEKNTKEKEIKTDNNNNKSNEKQNTNHSDFSKPAYSKYDEIFNHNSIYNNTKQFECQYCFKRMSDKEDLLSHQLICKRLSQNRLKTKYYSTKLPNNDYYPSKDYNSPTSTTTPMTECSKCNASMTTYDYLLHHCETPRSNFGNESARKNVNSAASHLSSSQSFKYPYRARPTLDSKLSSRRSFDSTTPGSAGTSHSTYTSSASSPRQPINTPSDFVFSKLRSPLSANKKQYPDIASPPTTKSQYIPSSSKRSTQDTENNQPIKPVIKTNFSFNNPIKKTSLFNGVPQSTTGATINSNSTYGGLDNQYSPSTYRAAIPQQSFTATYTKPYSSFSSPNYSKSSKLVSNASFSGLGSTKYYPFNSSYTGLKREKLRTGF